MYYGLIALIEKVWENREQGFGDKTLFPRVDFIIQILEYVELRNGGHLLTLLHH